MDRHQAEQLLKRYRAGNCTDRERRLVERWFNQELASGEWGTDIDWEAARRTIWNRMEPRRRHNVWRRLPYVAAVLVATAIASWYFFDNQSRDESKIVEQRETDIPAGGNRATLTLVDGRTITLDEARDGIVIENGTITYKDGNRLADAEEGGEHQVNIPLLKLSTPKGGTYQITLPDGSRVWLNAASTLKYPARFDGDERMIELEGEAYFDVVPASQNVPFKVMTRGQVIEVLGTEFNVSAYADDHESKTTLVTGKVRVKPIVPDGSNNSSPISYLEPGQQATTRGSSIQVSQVDVFDYTAWKDGIIVLSGARLADVMRQLERWYDVAINIPAFTTNNTAYVLINRNENLLSVLKALEETYQVKLKLEERRVSIIEE